MSKNKDTKNLFKTPLFWVTVATFLISISTPSLNILYDYLEDGYVTKESIAQLIGVSSVTALGVLEILRERFEINKETLDLINMALNRDELVTKAKEKKTLISTPSGLPGRTTFED